MGKSKADSGTTTKSKATGKLPVNLVERLQSRAAGTRAGDEGEIEPGAPPPAGG